MSYSPKFHNIELTCTCSSRNHFHSRRKVLGWSIEIFIVLILQPVLHAIYVCV